MGKSGSNLLVDKSGFMYQRTHAGSGLKTSNKMNWICYDQKEFKCLGSATTEGLYIVKKIPAHNHAPTQKQSRLNLEQNIPVFFFN